MLRIVGDSHAQACFQGFPGAEIESINSRTAWRIARDGVQIEGKVWRPPTEGDVTVWLFGEIDCRCHLQRIADRDGTWPDRLASDLGWMYVRRICDFAGINIVCNVVPPSDLANSPEYPIYGDLRQRSRVTRWFNESCHQVCQQMKCYPELSFCDFYDAYALPDGSLNQALSDGNVHVAVEHNQACRDALAKILWQTL